MRHEGIYAETLGQGEELVLLHGWGMCSGFMRPFAERLAQRFQVTLVDLPGHGRSGLIPDLGVAGIAAAILERVSQGAHWVGWSLGAMIALQVAGMKPEAVQSLSLLAGTPCFVAASDWPGVEPAILSRFAAGLQGNYARTIDRFLALQLHGMVDERQLLKVLRSTVAAQRPPEEAGLRAGLAILYGADLRPILANWSGPLLVLLGRRDRLIPVAAGPACAALNPHVEVVIIDDAAHIPFWTHADATHTVLERFLFGHAELAP